jgi:acyl carrier protein
MEAKEMDVKTSIVNFIHSNFLMGTGAVNFNHDDSFLEKGIVDSTGVLEMVSFIQSTFGITVEDSDLTPENLDSVNRVASYIQRKTTSS